MIKLTDLARVSSTFPIIIAGHTVQARPVTGLESRNILNVCRHPAAPMRVDDEGRRYQDTSDPEYRYKYKQWSSKYLFAHIMVAIGMTDEAGKQFGDLPIDQAKRMLDTLYEQAIRPLSERGAGWTDEDIQHAHDQYDKATNPAAIEKKSAASASSGDGSEGASPDPSANSQS